MQPTPEFPRLTLDVEPSADFRAELGQRINAFHSETVPFQVRRFTVRAQDNENRLIGGLSGAMAWNWLFIDAVWVDAAARGQGAGRSLMAHAEDHARKQGCHSAWLDTFQAKGFYEMLGYQVFGMLEDYPSDQTRYFLRKQLTG